MVIIETAAITAGGVAAYKGGKAAIEGAGKKLEKMKRKSARKEERKSLKKDMKNRKKERNSMLAQIDERCKNRDQPHDSEGNKKSSLLSSFTSSKKKSNDHNLSEKIENRMQKESSDARLGRLRQKHKSILAKDKKKRFPFS